MSNNTPKAVAASAEFSDSPPSATVSCQQPKHKIDVQYLYTDHAETPVADIPYRLTNRSDRSVVIEGATDKAGKIHQEGLIGGQYDLELIPTQDTIAQQRAQELRKEFQQTLNDIILNVQQSTQYQEQVLSEMHWAEEGLVYTGAFAQGAYDSISSFGEFIASVGKTLYAAEKAYLDLWGDIITGNFDEIERKIENNSAAASRFFNATEENFEKLVLLVSDRKVREALYQFPQQYWDALSSVEKTRVLASVGTDIALEILIAVVSGGLAIPAQLAKLAQSSAKLISKAIQLLDELAKVLKQLKPRKKVRVPVNQEKTFYVKNKADNHLAANHGGSTNQPGVTDSGKASPSIEKTKTSGEPISMVTGEEILSLTDFTLPGLLPLEWKRIYRSGNDRNQGLGVGWTHPFCERLSISDDAVVLSNAEGSHVYLPKPDVGEFTVNETEGVYLHREYHNIYIVKQKNQPTKHFSGQSIARLDAITDKRGHAWQCIYEIETGQLKGIKSSWASQLKFTYENGNLSQVLLILEHQHPMPLASYAYDIDNNLVCAADRSQNPEYYQYKNHLLIRRTLKSGYNFYLQWDQYNKSGKCIKQWGDNGNYQYTFEWDEENRVSKSIDSNGGVLEVHYNSAGLVTKEISPGGNTTLFEYDENNRLAKKTNANEHSFEYRYDEFGNITAFLDPAGGGYAISYDDNQNPIEYSDAVGNSWITEYDQQGLITKTITPEGFETLYYYNQNGLPITIINPDGNKRFLEWNDQGHLIADSHGASDLTSPTISQYQHNALGEVVKIKNGLDHTHYHYDQSGNLTHIQYPDGRHIKMAYNAAGQLTSHTDPGGKSTRFEYDGLSQITKRINASGFCFQYHYDAERNLIGLTNEKGEQYHLTYDADEQLIEEIGFDGRVQQYQYDSAGYLTHHIEGNHQDDDVKESNTTVFHRDPLGRLLQKRCPDGEIINFAFNANGQLIEAINKSRTLQFDYTASGLLSKEVQDTHTLTHEYDHFGNRTQTTLPNGEQVTYQHNLIGQLESIHYNQSCITQIQRDALGREQSRQQGQLTSQWDYDPAGRLTKHSVLHQQSKQHIIKRDYHYDPTGNLSQIDDLLNGPTRYTYDPLNQLKSVEGYINEYFDFDPAGNITQEQSETKGNRLSFLGDRHFTYDTRGNLVEERRGKGQKLVTQYRYNTQNQLTQVEKGNQQFEYEYDALGRRVSKKDAFGVTQFLWNGDVLLQEERKSKKRFYIYEPESFKPLAHIENNQCYFYHLDHLGTPQEITSWEGKVVWSGKYKAYGNLALKQVEDVENNIRFQGQYFDDETGLHYNRHRYFDPGVGQFISQDPIGLLGGENLYQYAPNPIHWIDPLGQTSKESYGEEEYTANAAQYAKLKEAYRAQDPDRAAIDARYDELAQQGHGPQRHGAEITHTQMKERAIEGKDPVTGTTQDAYKRDRQGNPMEHSYSKNATHINSKEGYVKAEKAIRESEDFKNKAASSNRPIEVDVPLEDIFGPNYLSNAEGVTRIGTKRNPDGFKPTDFTDGYARGRYRKNAQTGEWELITLYPEPKN